MLRGYVTRNRVQEIPPFSPIPWPNAGGTKPRPVATGAGFLHARLGRLRPVHRPLPLIPTFFHRAQEKPKYESSELDHKLIQKESSFFGSRSIGTAGQEEG